MFFLKNKETGKYLIKPIMNRHQIGGTKYARDASQFYTREDAEALLVEGEEVEEIKTKLNRDDLAYIVENLDDINWTSEDYRDPYNYQIIPVKVVKVTTNEKGSAHYTLDTFGYATSSKVYDHNVFTNLEEAKLKLKEKLNECLADLQKSTENKISEIKERLERV